MIEELPALVSGNAALGRRPVFMLTGEYDYSCTPEASRATAELIPGAELAVMRGLGHFPMPEAPERFRRFLSPVLQRIG